MARRKSSGSTKGRRSSGSLEIQIRGHLADWIATMLMMHPLTESPPSKRPRRNKKRGGSRVTRSSRGKEIK